MKPPHVIQTSVPCDFSPHGTHVVRFAFDDGWKIVHVSSECSDDKNTKTLRAVADALIGEDEKGEQTGVKNVCCEDTANKVLDTLRGRFVLRTSVRLTDGTMETDMPQLSQFVYNVLREATIAAQTVTNNRFSSNRKQTRIELLQQPLLLGRLNRVFRSVTGLDQAFFDLERTADGSHRYPYAFPKLCVPYITAPLAAYVGNGCWRENPNNRHDLHEYGITLHKSEYDEPWRCPCCGVNTTRPSSHVRNSKRHRDRFWKAVATGIDAVNTVLGY